MAKRELLRQSLWYLLVGLVQLALDVAVFSALFYAGVSVLSANVSGRIAGACLGFWLNGRLTFARDGNARLGRQRLARFVIAWLAITALSTLAMWGADAVLSRADVYLAKPIIELVCALIGFVIARQWIYR